MSRPAIRDNRQFLDVDRDRLGSVLGCCCRLRYHDGDGFADIAHLADGDHRLLERPENLKLLLPQRNGRDVADRGRRDDGMHAGPRQRGGGIDSVNAAMRHGAAHDHSMQRSGRAQVVDVLAPAAKKAQILDAFDRAADEGIRWARSVRGTFGIT